MITTILFLLVLSILVFVHELGHFLFAKLFKIRVDEFAIGFPPRIFGKKYGETTYAVNLLPLGGYVKIHGENPEDVTDTKDKRNFQNVSWWKQVIVLVAGVTFNIIFAWLLLSLSLMIGTTKASTEGIPAEYIKGTQSVVIQAVFVDTPAAVAGLLPGEIIRSVQNTPVTSAQDVQNIIHAATGTVVVETEKAGEKVTHTITPQNAAIGVSLAEVASIRMPLLPALSYGAQGTYNLTQQLGTGVFQFFGKLFVGNASWNEVSGPVGIAKVVGGAGREGVTSLLFVAALISISLAIMNILPFPALDGGRVVVALIEGVIRKRLNAKIVNAVNTVGFVLLITLMIIVTFKDIF
ncbi:MAG: site-2 protease family protein [Patescibacteria group bacterium]